MRPKQSAEPPLRSLYFCIFLVSTTIKIAVQHTHTMFSAEMMNEATWQQYLDYDRAGPPTTQRLAKGIAAHNMKELPVDFCLGEHDVICGRGRKCFHHIGNQRFRELVLDMLEKYADSPSKLDKSFIICDVVNTIRTRSPNGGFVKFDTQNGRYYEVGDFLAVGLTA